MDRINIHFNQVSEAMTLIDRDQIREVVEVLRLVRRHGNRVYICGNGGSHATASHFVNDLVKQSRVKAHCIGDDAPTVFAYGNDEGWDNMFSEAIRGKFEYGDCVFGISCSGNSQNVVNALDLAQKNNGFTLGLTGMDGNSKMAGMGLDGLVLVPFPDIRVQEDLHTVICHAVVRALQNYD